MTHLDSQQQQLLFDHAFGLTSERDADEAERLLATDPEAVHIYNALRNALSPLEALEVGPCPDVLAERTISVLKDKAQSSEGQVRLEQLLEAEQVGTSRIRIQHLRKLQ